MSKGVDMGASILQYDVDMRVPGIILASTAVCDLHALTGCDK